MIKSRMLMAPFPSVFACLVSRRTRFCTLFICNSAESSIVIMRSSSGIKLDSALRKVVFPEPVPPLTKILYFARTQLSKNCAASSLTAPKEIRSSKLITFSGNLRIVTVAPFKAIGGSTILTREPSFSLASQMGFRLSTVRFTCPTIFCIISSSCLLLSNFSGLWYSLPAFSTKMQSDPFIITSVISLSSRMGCKMPRCLILFRTALTAATRSVTVIYSPPNIF